MMRITMYVALSAGWKRLRTADASSRSSASVAWCHRWRASDGVMRSPEWTFRAIAPVWPLSGRLLSGCLSRAGLASVATCSLYWQRLAFRLVRWAAHTWHRPIRDCRLLRLEAVARREAGAASPDLQALASIVSP